MDVTNELLKTEEDYVALFDWLNGKKEIDQKAFFEISGFWTEKRDRELSLELCARQTLSM